MGAYLKWFERQMHLSLFVFSSSLIVTGVPGRPPQLQQSMLVVTYIWPFSQILSWLLVGIVDSTELLLVKMMTFLHPWDVVAVRTVSSLFIWPCGVWRTQRKVDTLWGIIVAEFHQLCVLWWALSLPQCSTPSVSSLQPSGTDRVHCSLHGNCITCCVPLLLSFYEQLLLPHCCWVSQVPSVAAPSSQLFMQSSSTPPPLCCFKERAKLCFEGLQNMKNLKSQH